MDPTPNSLNRSMQGLWSTHRKARINLNSNAPLSPGPTTSDPVAQEEPPPEEPIQAVNGKRKRAQDSSSGKRAKLSTHSPPSARLADLAGIDTSVSLITEYVALPLTHPEIYAHIGVQPPRGVLLHGPPGCGKTRLANAIAGELGIPFVNISAPSIVSGMSGESEKGLRDAFDEAKKLAPSILFIDEIDAITPKRESAQREMERRIVAQFLTCMDDLSSDDNKPVVVIGATNRPDSLDAALRRAGRFDHEISLGVPDDDAREKILRLLSSKLRVQDNFDFKALARATPGYVGADLASLVSTAGIIAVKRIFGAFEPDGDVTMDAGSPPASPISHFLTAHPNTLTPEQLAPLNITFEDFLLALKQVQPSAKREGFATIPDVSWSDIGALTGIREELQLAIVEPIKSPELFQAVGIEAASGVLLWGPPGCGKTLLAKAVANESKANFISVKGPELLNKYVGESERAVRQLFSRARASSPCVIFFDELDALVPKREDSLSESSARVVNTLLTELDGLESRKKVYVIAATNRPDMIDPAMVRPGRLDKTLYVDLPSAAERVEIVKTLSRRLPLDGPQVIEEIGELVKDKGDGYSGADIAALIREAGVVALKRVLQGGKHVVVCAADFAEALKKVNPSVSAAERKKYHVLAKRWTS